MQHVQLSILYKIYNILWNILAKIKITIFNKLQYNSLK